MSYLCGRALNGLDPQTAATILAVEAMCRTYHRKVVVSDHLSIFAFAHSRSFLGGSNGGEGGHYEKELWCANPTEQLEGNPSQPRPDAQTALSDSYKEAMNSVRTDVRCRCGLTEKTMEFVEKRLVAANSRAMQSMVKLVEEARNRKATQRKRMQIIQIVFPALLIGLSLIAVISGLSNLLVQWLFRR